MVSLFLAGVFFALVPSLLVLLLIHIFFRYVLKKRVIKTYRFIALGFNLFWCGVYAAVRGGASPAEEQILVVLAISLLVNAYVYASTGISIKKIEGIES